MDEQSNQSFLIRSDKNSTVEWITASLQSLRLRDKKTSERLLKIS